jgi:cobalt-zinc-cadmium efflux system outer membrane protein
MAESELAQAEADLQTFVRVGQGPAGVQVEVDSLPLDTSRTSATAMRPEVEAARQRVVASEAAAASEKRLFLRELGAMVGTKTMGGSSSLVTGFTVPLPLLDQNRGSIDAARADRDAAKFDLEFEQRRSDADRLGAEKAARILSQRVAAFGSGPRGYLARAEESRRIALGAYREGGATLLQVIDAARAWREARDSYFETLFAQHRAVIRLMAAHGVDILDAWPGNRPGASQ